MFIFSERETHVEDQGASGDTINRLVEESYKEKDYIIKSMI